MIESDHMTQPLFSLDEGVTLYILFSSWYKHIHSHLSADAEEQVCLQR